MRTAGLTADLDVLDPLAQESTSVRAGVFPYAHGIIKSTEVILVPKMLADFKSDCLIIGMHDTYTLARYVR